ncbi:MAG: CoA-transferase subunit beta [Thermoplasmata archaeon]
MVEVKTAELMASVLSKHLEDGEVAIMGAFSAIPMLASRLAQMTHAPNLTYIAGGSGAVNPLLEPLVASSCDDRLLRAECILPLSDVIDFEARTEIDIFFAGGLQIDERGNCNLIGVGKPGEMKLRGPGSVGLPFLSRARRYAIYAMNHSPRTFVENVDFISGPGFVEGKNFPGGGPSLVVTPMCVMDFHEKRMRLMSVHPGVSVDDVVENTGFNLQIPEKVFDTELPTEKELELMREIDPLGVARNSL